MEVYFKCAIKIEFETEKGKIKYRREDYIVSAVSPTDVETKITEHLKGYDFEIISIVVTKIIDIVK